MAGGGGGGGHGKLIRQRTNMAGKAYWELLLSVLIMTKSMEEGCSYFKNKQPENLRKQLT